MFLGDSEGFERKQLSSCGFGPFLVRHLFETCFGSVISQNKKPHVENYGLPKTKLH